MKKDESYANTDTLANLYNKVGDKKNARLWAEKSVELAKNPVKIAETQKLLDSKEINFKSIKVILKSCF